MGAYGTSFAVALHVRMRLGEQVHSTKGERKAEREVIDSTWCTYICMIRSLAAMSTSPTSTSTKLYTLLGRDGVPYRTPIPGAFGGHRKNRLYGRLDCRSALSAIARGHYVRHRVFFQDEPTAIAAGYRPCAVCLPEKYAEWKARTGGPKPKPRKRTNRRAGAVASERTDSKPGRPIAAS